MNPEYSNHMEGGIDGIGELHGALSTLEALLSRTLGSLAENTTELAAIQSVRLALERVYSLHFRPQSSSVAQHAEIHREVVMFVLGNNLDDILEFCQLPAIVALGQTSRALRVCTTEYLSRSFNKLLSRWFEDELDVRGEMKQINAVISGSAALQFISRDTHWRAKDLDIYVPRGKARQFVEYLAVKEGYDLIREHEPFAYSGDSNIHDIFQLSRSANHYTTDTDSPTSSDIHMHSINDIKGDRIDIIEAVAPSPIVPILYFHTTFVMNWISPSRIVVLYPNLTFARKGIDHHPFSLSKQRDWKKKYINRGFQIEVTSKDSNTPCGAACPALVRCTGDVGVMEAFPNQERVREATPAEYDWVTGHVEEPPSILRCSNRRCPRGKPQNTLGLRPNVGPVFRQL